jgi:hypothetical protein
MCIMIYRSSRFCSDFVVLFLLPVLMGEPSKRPTTEEFIPGQSSVNVLVYAISVPQLSLLHPLHLQLDYGQSFIIVMNSSFNSDWLLTECRVVCGRMAWVCEYADKI